jgi:serine/threonine protein phosphatase PrpC
VTATFIDHKKKMFYVANAGNSRCLFGKNGRLYYSRDHIPDDSIELDRIYGAKKRVF